MSWISRWLPDEWVDLDQDADQTERLPEAKSMPYRDYLRTGHWMKKRQRALLRSGGMCQRCYAEGRPLEIHHLTYTRLGFEGDADLIALCATCHAKEHGGVS